MSPRQNPLDSLLETLLFLVLAAIVAILFANVIGRYVLGASLSWGEEVALLLMVWLTYLGALVFFPRFWRIAWFQMVLIVILLGDLGYGIWALNRNL